MAGKKPKYKWRWRGRTKSARRGSPFAIPLGPVIGLAAPFVAAYGATPSFAQDIPTEIKQRGMMGGVQEYAARLTVMFTGFNPVRGEFQTGLPEAFLGLKTLFVGAVVHKAIGGWLGVNRVLAKYKIPVRL